MNSVPVLPPGYFGVLAAVALVGFLLWFYDAGARSRSRAGAAGIVLMVSAASITPPCLLWNVCASYAQLRLQMEQNARYEHEEPADP